MNLIIQNKTNPSEIIPEFGRGRKVDAENNEGVPNRIDTPTCIAE